MKTGIPNQGTILDIEMGIHASNVALIDPVDRRRTRAEMFLVQEEDGTLRKARIATRTRNEIPAVEVPKKIRLGWSRLTLTHML